MRAILPGSRLNEIAGSLLRYPDFRVLVWNPNEVTINQLASGAITRPPIDISGFVESIDYSENIGFENGDDPSVPQITLNLRRVQNAGVTLRRGLIEDGVIVQVFEGDRRIRKDEWTPIFTGTFRGRPGDDPGTPARQSEGMQVNAYGREERYLNHVVTTESFDLKPDDTPPVTEIDLGEIAVAIAQKHLGLGQNEILFGSQGVVTKHLTNQIVDSPALEALYQCLFPAGKKPKFDSLGRLVAVDVNLDKPPARIYSGGDYLIESKIATPNDVEVNNSVLLRGLRHDLSRIVQGSQLLVEFEVVTGFFDAEFEEDEYYSQDHSQRAQDTFLKTKTKIQWSAASWTEVDEFHGHVSIDTHFLRNVRILIFTLWLAVQIAVAAIDFIFQLGVIGIIVNIVAGPELAAIRIALQLASLATMALLLWAMNFIGRGRYQVHGKPFEYVYREIISQHELVGLLPEEIRRIELRNDFISTMDALDAACAERLRREMLKNQLYTIVVLADPLLEVDDVIETANGDRFYIQTIERSISRGAKPTMTLSCWKIEDALTRQIDALELAAAGGA